MVVNKIILINEFVTQEKGSKGVKKKLKELDDTQRKTTKGRKDFLTQFTRVRWAIVNIALIGALAVGMFRLIKPIFELETEMANVRKTTGLTSEELKGLTSEILELSKTTPQSAVELAKVAAVAGQLGIEGRDNIIEFTRVADMMGTATVLTSEEAGLALAKLSQAFNLPISQVEKLGSAINELSNSTAANSKEIVGAMNRMASSANQLGITVDVAAAISASLVEMGMRSERAGTRMRTAFTRMATQTSQIAKLFREVGGEINITGDIIAKRLDTDATKIFMDVLSLLVSMESGTDRLKEATEIFGKVGATAINGLVSNYIDLQRNVVLASEEFKKAESLQKEFNIALETTANQWNILFGNLQASMIETGQTANTVFGGFLEKINETMSATRLLNAIFKEFLVERGAAFRKERFGEIDVPKETIDALKELGLIDPRTSPILTIPIEQLNRLNELIELGDKKKIVDELARIESDKSTLSLGEEKKKIEELTKARIALFEASQIEDTEERRASLIEKTRELGEVEESLSEITAEQAVRIQEVAFAEANRAVGIEDLTKVQKELSEQQELYNATLKVLQEDFALSSQSIEEYAEEIKKLNDEFPELTRFLEAQSFKLKEKETESLTDITKEYRLEINRLQRELRGVGTELSNVRDQIMGVQQGINTIRSRRFNIRGISETNIGGIIRQQQIEIDRARFATLGLGTAEEFLRNASVLTTDSIDDQTEAVMKLTAAASDGQDQFDAWQTTLRETIRSLLLSSQDIDKDVTEVIRKAQTELLSITRFDRAGGDQFSALEENLDSLGLAQNIFFGEEKNKLQFSEELREDRINGMNESAAQAISNLEAQRSTLEALVSQEQDWITQQSRIRDEIERNRESIDRETAAFNRRNQAMRGGSGGSIGVGGGGGLEATKKSEFVFSLLSRQAALQDFISRPGQPIQSFSPQDTIIGVKDRAPGVGATNNVVININGFNRNETELATEVARKINALA